MRARYRRFWLARRPLIRPLGAYWAMETLGLDSGSFALLLSNNNDATQVTGKVGQAGQFTAADSQYLSRASHPILQTGDTSWTFGMWAYLDSLGTNKCLVSKGNPAEFSLICSSADRFNLTVGGLVTQNANAFGPVTTATWYHVLAWHDAPNKTIGISVNGLANTTTYVGTPAVNTGNFQVGRLSTSQYWDGRIDEIGFWRRVLTTRERDWLYNAGTGRSFTELGSYSARQILLDRLRAAWGRTWPRRPFPVWAEAQLPRLPASLRGATHTRRASGLLVPEYAP